MGENIEIDSKEYGVRLLAVLLWLWMGPLTNTVMNIRVP